MNRRAAGVVAILLSTALYTWLTGHTSLLAILGQGIMFTGIFGPASLFPARYAERSRSCGLPGVGRRT